MTNLRYCSPEQIEELLKEVELERKYPYWRLCECCGEGCDCGCVDLCPVHKGGGLDPIPEYREDNP